MPSRDTGLERYQAIIDQAPEAIVVTDTERGEIVQVNSQAERLFGRDRGELIGSPHTSLHPGEEEAGYRERLEDVVEEIRDLGEGGRRAFSKLNDGTQMYILTGGEERIPVEINSSTLELEGESYVMEVVRDISSRLKYEEEVEQQKAAVRQLSTPVVEVWEGIITVPLVGIIDSQRAQQITENLLKKVQDTGADIAIIDITGVPSVDTEVANRLIKSVKAARLLGTESYLVGIQPDIAESLVHLGVDLSDIETFSDLQSGLRRAFIEKDIELVRGD